MAVFLGMLSFCFGQEAPRKLNLIRNSSFEILDAGMAGGWGSGGAFHEQISVDNEVAWHGQRSIHFLLDGRAQGDTRLSGGGMLPFEIGKTYTFSAYIKTKNLVPAGGIKILLITSNWTASSPVIEPDASTSAWKRYSATFTVGKTKTGNWRMIVMPGDGAAGEAWVDAVQVEEGAQATEYKVTE